MLVDDKLAKEKQLFLEWFTANYPPHCIISNPAWHADKIYRTARKLIRNTDLTDCQQTAEWWLIYFEDKDRGPEVFNDEPAAKARFEQISVSWNATLFRSIAPAPDQGSVRNATDELRLSKSGYSLRVGWGDEKRIVAVCPGSSTTQHPDEKVFKQWLEDSDRLIAGWNANTRTS